MQCHCLSGLAFHARIVLGARHVDTLRCTAYMHVDPPDGGERVGRTKCNHTSVFASFWPTVAHQAVWPGQVAQSRQDGVTHSTSGVYCWSHPSTFRYPQMLQSTENAIIRRHETPIAHIKDRCRNIVASGLCTCYIARYREVARVT
jgi:hypothetical protein